jgi:hypothetical protein
MRQIDAIFTSNPFWGIVALFFLVVGSAWKDDVVKALALCVGWSVGSYVFYRFWSSQTVQDWRLFGSFILVYTGIVLFLYYSVDPRRPVSRSISAEPVGRGRSVAEVSLLNVGAAPSPEPIANPPDWIQPDATMQLIFQDSPLLTNEIKHQVTQDISAFREYLLRLRIPVSDDFPPIGVSDGPGSTQAQIAGSLPTYRSSVKITRGWFVNRRAITEQYAYYAINDVLTRGAAQHRGGSALQDMIASSALSQYYNWSFWDHKPNAEGGHWSSQLWDIRSSFGKDFTDQLLGFTIKSILDSPEEGADANFDIYFHHKLQQGDSVIDSDPERMSKITNIIEKSGINVTTPRAYFDFSATAVKRHDGSFVVNVVATNKSDVPANKGRFRVYFAPDVQLLIDPKGSSKDASFTLRSARLIPFDSISAHTPFKIQLEFMPISKAFFETHFFVVHVDGGCETCGIDNYSHDLKFTLNAFKATQV